MDLKDLLIVILIICILGIFFFGSVGSFFTHIHYAVGELTGAEAKNGYFTVDYLEGKTDNPYGHSSDSSSYRQDDSSKGSSPEFLGFSIDQNTHSIKSSSSELGSHSSGSGGSSGSSSSGGSGDYSSGSVGSSGSGGSSGSSSSGGSGDYSSGSVGSSSSGGSSGSSSHSSKSNSWFPNIFPDKKTDNSHSSNKSIIPSNNTNRSIISGNDTNHSIIPSDWTNKSDNSSNSSDAFPVKYEDYQINYETDIVDEEGNPVILSIVSTSGNQSEPGVYKVYWSKLGVINQTKIK